LAPALGAFFGLHERLPGGEIIHDSDCDRKKPRRLDASAARDFRSGELSMVKDSVSRRNRRHLPIGHGPWVSGVEVDDLVIGVRGWLLAADSHAAPPCFA
jgi:hypothetical protein